LKYQVLQPGYLPVGFGNQTIAKFGEITEILYKTDNQFLILTQTAAAEGESLPDGEVATVNGQPAVLNKGISGSYRELPGGMHPLDGGGVVIIPDGTSSSSADDGAAPSDGQTHSSGVVSQSAATEQPLTFDYTDAVKLTFITSNTKIELLSNLPVEEILKIAEGLVPAK
jgi:hypothetical protein